jgi:hypothetical protein
MSRSLTAQDRSSLIRLASGLPKGDTTRRAILAGLAATPLKKVGYDDDYEDPEDSGESDLDEDVVADAIFVRSEGARKRKSLVGPEELLEMAWSELERYGHRMRDVEAHLEGAIEALVKSKNLMRTRGGYMVI